MAPAPDSAPRRPGRRRRNLAVLVLAALLVAPMIGLVAYAPTLYRMFCAATGFGGTVRQAAAPAAKTAADGPTVTVAFDANVAPGLPWDFRPLQHKVELRLGETARIYFEAKNNADHPTVGHASFNVTPYAAAPYFFKIQCFCFTDERLGPGESARMPVELFVDEAIRDDPNANTVRRITLSYTFFAQPDADTKDATAARDLAAASKSVDANVQDGGAARFDNDAPRE
jgi:cytochrome c oxidase assembly protein subunit 11